jgi:hypothetical protein
MNTIGNTVLKIVQMIFLALLRIVLFAVAWCFKLSSRIIEKIGDEILKISEK